MCTAYLNRTDFAALFRFEPHFQSLAVTNGNWVLTLFSPSADWLGREGRKAAERHWEGLLTGRHTWAWGEMDDLVSRDSSLGLRRLCPCTFLLTPTWSPTAQRPTEKKRPSAWCPSAHTDTLRPVHMTKTCTNGSGNEFLNELLFSYSFHSCTPTAKYTQLIIRSTVWAQQGHMQHVSKQQCRKDYVNRFEKIFFRWCFQSFLCRLFWILATVAH